MISKTVGYIKMKYGSSYDIWKDGDEKSVWITAYNDTVKKLERLLFIGGLTSDCRNWRYGNTHIRVYIKSIRDLNKFLECWNLTCGNKMMKYEITDDNWCTL